MSKESELIKRAEKLIKRAEELGLTKEQKHINAESSPEKEYWHYGYGVCLMDVIRNFYLREIEQVKAVVMPEIKRVKIVKQSRQGIAWFDKRINEIIEVVVLNDKTLLNHLGVGDWYILAEDYAEAIQIPKTYRAGLHYIKQRYCEVQV